MTPGLVLTDEQLALLERVPDGDDKHKVFKRDELESSDQRLMDGLILLGLVAERYENEGVVQIRLTHLGQRVREQAQA